MSGTHTVEKIGGTSIAASDTVFNSVLVAERTGANLYNRIFVVSAYAGMTDLLLEHKSGHAGGVYARFVAGDEGAGWRDALKDVRAAMRAKNSDVFARPESRVAADDFIATRIAVMHGCLEDIDRLRRHGHFHLGEPLAVLREMLAGLGEAHSAYNTALQLRERGVNALLIDLTEWRQRDLLPLDDRIQAGLVGVDLETVLPIVTGYAACKGGMVALYGRGYSEMTFSRLAALTGAREAIIHKEFHLSSADPKLVGREQARKIGRTNYDVADQLANLGMEAIHPRAGRGLRQSGIPLRVRNTFDRHDEGTLICSDYVSQRAQVEIVTGLKSLFALQFFEQDMVGEKGFDAAILESLTREQAWIVSKSSNANTITHYLAAPAATVRRVIRDLEARFPAAAVSARQVAMVSVIGSDISAPGLVAACMAALSDAGIHVLGLQHQIRNVDIQFIVEPADFEPAIRHLHSALIGAAAVAPRDRAA